MYHFEKDNILKKGYCLLCKEYSLFSKDGYSHCCGTHIDKSSSFIDEFEAVEIDDLKLSEGDVRILTYMSKGFLDKEIHEMLSIKGITPNSLSKMQRIRDKISKRYNSNTPFQLGYIIGKLGIV